MPFPLYPGPPVKSEQPQMSHLHRPDLRRIRADYMTAAVMNELEDLLSPEARESVHHRLQDLFWRNGAFAITDDERRQLGLEPRDNTGWTPSERQRQRQAEREQLIRMREAVLRPVDGE